MQSNARPARVYAVSRTNRPKCPEHGKLLRVESSVRQVAYCYCSQPGCRHSAKVLRRKLAGAS